MNNDLLGEKFDECVSVCKSILLKKYKQRGSSNIDAQGLYGLYNRAFLDKSVRIRRLVELRELNKLANSLAIDICIEDSIKVNMGDIYDDLYDIINYVVIMMIILKDGCLP